MNEHGGYPDYGTAEWRINKLEQRIGELEDQIAEHESVLDAANCESVQELFERAETATARWLSWEARAERLEGQVRELREALFTLLGAINDDLLVRDTARHTWDAVPAARDALRETKPDGE